MSYDSDRWLEAGLTWYFDAQRRLRGGVVTTRGFRRSTMARCISSAVGRPHFVTADEVSTYLQEYRLAQASEPKKWHLACTGYGRAARWHVIVGPGLPAPESQGMLHSHARWVIHDLADRAVSDFTTELLPAADRHVKVMRPRIAAAKRRIEQALEVFAEDAAVAAEEWASYTGNPVPALNPLPTPDEELVEAEVMALP